MTPEQVAAWFERSRAAQGLPPTFSDAAHVAIARLLRGIDEHADDGPTTAKTPTARSRTRRKDPA